jgi:YVTN family beta-propeller protein
VSLLSDGAVVVLNRRTLDVVKTIPTGGAPRYIAFDRSGARAYVTNESGWVDVIR